MNEIESKSGVKFNSILYGVLIMIFSAIIWFYTGTAIIFLVYLINIIILISGIARFSNAITNNTLSNIGKAVKFISGILLIILAFIIFILTLGDPSFSTEILIFLLLIGLLVIGVARLGTGFLNKKFINWYRIFLIIIGILTIILNLIPLLNQTLGDTLVIYLISISLFVNGFTRFLYGLIGKEKMKKIV